MKQESPQEYTNRELAMLISGNNDTNLLQHEALRKSIVDFHETTNTTLQTILAQTTKTNGRVNKLELWQSYVGGQTWIIPIIVSSIVGGVVAFLFNFLK